MQDPPPDDIDNLIITDGTNQIYSQYAEGKIDKETALIRLTAFLDSKGIPEHSLIALKTVKNWKR